MKVTYGAIVQRASGRFGGTVHSNWKGIDLVRRFAAPSNPNTTNQQNVRTLFANLTRSFQMFSSTLVTMWTAYATGKKFLDRNKYIGLNVPALQGAADLQSLILYPGDAGAVPPTATSVTGGVGTLDVVGAIPTPPNGWTTVALLAFVCQDNDPQSTLPLSMLAWYEDADVAAPFDTCSLTLPAATYRAWLIAKYTNPAGATVFSPSVQAGPGIVT